MPPETRRSQQDFWRPSLPRQDQQHWRRFGQSPRRQTHFGSPQMRLEASPGCQTPRQPMCDGAVSRHWTTPQTLAGAGQKQGRGEVSGPAVRHVPPARVLPLPNDPAAATSVSGDTTGIVTMATKFASFFSPDQLLHSSE